jgi:hypothetical protein
MRLFVVTESERLRAWGEVAAWPMCFINPLFKGLVPFRGGGQSALHSPACTPSPISRLGWHGWANSPRPSGGMCLPLLPSDAPEVAGGVKGHLVDQQPASRTDWVAVWRCTAHTAPFGVCPCSCRVCCCAVCATACLRRACVCVYSHSFFAHAHCVSMPILRLHLRLCHLCANKAHSI